MLILLKYLKKDIKFQLMNTDVNAAALGEVTLCSKRKESCVYITGVPVLGGAVVNGNHSLAIAILKWDILCTKTS